MVIDISEMKKKSTVDNTWTLPTWEACSTLTLASASTPNELTFIIGQTIEGEDIGNYPKVDCSNRLECGRTGGNEWTFTNNNEWTFTNNTTVDGTLGYQI